MLWWGTSASRSIPGIEPELCRRVVFSEALPVYDYLCRPPEKMATRELAIDSIPAYVGRCWFFVIPCPPVRHVITNEVLNKQSWGTLGERSAAEAWCGGAGIDLT